MSPARKKTAKKATKKTTARKKPAKKAPAKKKAAAKPAKAAKKKATKKAATRAGKKAATKATKKAAKKAGKKAGKKAEPPKKPSPPPKPGKLVVAAGKKIPKLGVRWTCWGCEAVFYDLNKPDPVCPKCGQDQHEKPEAEKPSTPAPKRDSMRALRVLDDDDTPATDDSSQNMELDLELGTDEKLLDQAEDAADTDED